MFNKNPKTYIFENKYITYMHIIIPKNILTDINKNEWSETDNVDI